MDDGKPKYMAAPGKHHLYVLPEWTKYEDEVTFVEGVFDAIAHFQATGKPTVAIGGKTLPPYLLPEIEDVSAGKRTMMLDADALKYSIRLARQLGGGFTVLPDGEDPGSYYTRSKDDRL
jgi:DNA primase